MDRNTTKYKVKQYIMFAGISTVLFAAVVIIPFYLRFYILTFTSWDGISKDKQFCRFLQIILQRFKDIAYWQALWKNSYIFCYFRCSGKCGCIFPGIFAD